jgi:hypothetical protein
VIRGASDRDAIVATCDRPAELLDCALSPLKALVVDDNCMGMADETRLCVGIAAEFTDRELLRSLRPAVHATKRRSTHMYRFLYMPTDFDLKTARFVT